ncbi:MAG: hypothetical protein ABSG78_11710 [Verrucomicrobiota bacterium]
MSHRLKRSFARWCGLRRAASALPIGDETVRNHHLMAGLPAAARSARLEPVVRIELCFQFSYEENIGFPSEDQEEFGVTRHYFSVLCQYFH